MTRKNSAARLDFSPVRGKRLLIALSGGADSVALAVMLAEAREEYALTLFAAHLDHGIRPESAGDAAFCRALCERLDIPFFSEAMDLAAEAAQARVGVETLARMRRHAWLEARRREARCDCVALAHHMDDQAETVLMHLARGAGVDGLGGMRALSGVLYRPLLGWRKSELEDFLRERDVPWREDATNRVADNPRNALRLNVVPQIEAWYPGFVRAAARLAETAQIEGDFLDALTGEYLRKGGAGGAFCAWLELDAPIPRALLRRAIRARCPEALAFEQVDALEALCGQSRGKLDIGADTYAERVGHRLYFVPKRLPTIAPQALSPEGETRLFPLGRVAVTKWDGGPVRDDPLRQALRREALKGAVLRTRQAGDRIRPLGGGDKLLSDYFIDKKVDRPLRDATPLVAAGHRVLWAVGLGIAQEAALAPGDEAVLLAFEWESVDYNGGKRHAE